MKTNFGATRNNRWSGLGGILMVCMGLAIAISCMILLVEVGSDKLPSTAAAPRHDCRCGDACACGAACKCAKTLTQCHQACCCPA